MQWVEAEEKNRKEDEEEKGEDDVEEKEENKKELHFCARSLSSTSAQATRLQLTSKKLKLAKTGITSILALYSYCNTLYLVQKKTTENCANTFN